MTEGFVITDLSQLPRLMRRLRKEQQVTQVDVAAAMGCDSTNLCAYEVGRRTPDLPTVLKWTQALGLTFAIVKSPSSADVAEDLVRELLAERFQDPTPRSTR